MGCCRGTIALSIVMYKVYFLTSSAFCLLCYRLIDMTDILLRVIFNGIVIESLLVCIRYCTIIEHFGLYALQSLTISLRFGLLRLNLTFVIL